MARLQTVPGVVHTGGVRKLPYQGLAWTSDFTIDSWSIDEFGVEVRHREATPGYFRTMGIPLLSGELFEKQLAPDEPVPVVVNLFGIEPSDPATFLSVAAILTVVATTSGYIPAWRATKVDPVKVPKTD